MEVVPLTHAAGQEVASLNLERHTQDADFTSSSDTRSIPASQASSFGELTSSQPSQLIGQQNGKDTSQAPAYQSQHPPNPNQSLHQPLNGTSTLLVNGSGLTQAVNGGAVPLIPRINTSFSTAEQTNARLTATQNDIKQGQKRTANGHVKTPSSSTMTSPDSASTTITTKGHTRQSSSSSQVGELSAQLRARLSYAMVKVQHGWESRTIDEVETLASQQPSPMSTTASPRRNFDSPRPNPTRLHDDTPAFAQSSVRTTLPPPQQMPAPRLNGTNNRDHAYSPSSQPEYAHLPPAPSAHPSAPSLAPPVNFSRHPRRHSKPLPPHPSLLNSSRHPSNLSASSTSSAPPRHATTPPQPLNSSTALLKTPSQRATAMEKDAIETLLFMSSPGNSQGAGHYGARNGSVQPGTPLRSGLLVADEGRVQPRKKEVWERGGMGDEESIDRVLDQMGDGESSSDEEGAGRGTVGGVGGGREVVYA